MKQVLLLKIVALFTLSCWGQTSDDVSYEKTSKEYFINFLKHHKNQNYTFLSLASVSDTANFKLYLPVLLLDEASDTLLNYQRISPYIEKKFSPHNQVVFISNSYGAFCFFISKGRYERLVRNSSTPHLLLPIPFGHITGISDRNPDLADRKFPFADKKITYERIQAYVDRNPDTQLFMIDELPGIWGYKDGRLIKLIFSRKEVREMDGEEYYRNYLFPLSPDGIGRVIRGESFKIVIVI